MPTQAGAVVIDSLDTVASVNTFTDTVTGKEWLDLTEVTATLTHAEKVTEAATLGYTLGTLNDINTLFGALPNPQTNYNTYSTMIGDYQNAAIGTYIMWGLFKTDDQATDLRMAYAWSQGHQGDLWTITNSIPSDGQRGQIGVWAYKSGGTAPIPEPATVALLGIGIVGLAGAEVRRRRKKKVVEKS